MPVNPRAVSLVEGAAALKRTGQQTRHEDFPYAWVYPPPGSIGRNPQTVVAAPANTVLTELLKFVVPDGYFFRMSGLILTYIGTPINDAGQLVTWNIDVNIPTSIGGTLTAPVLPSGYRVQDFGVVKVHLGSLDTGPYPIDGPLLFDPRAEIRVKVQTTAPFPAVGSGVFFVTRLRGYVWPENRL